MEKKGYIYVMANKGNNVLYTGVTGDLQKRVYQHKEKLVEGFTKRYNISKLVYFEQFESIISAIEREKQIKGGSRQDKINLIKSINPQFKDLYNDL